MNIIKITGHQNSNKTFVGTFDLVEVPQRRFV